MIVPPQSKTTSVPEPVPHASHPKYAERVYAGMLGKVIGVYLGRPVENWEQSKIEAEFGEIEYYVHEQRQRQLIVTDDDISGTITFLRAFEDSGYDPNLTPEQIGKGWLNYLIEEKTILWWGGLGNSTEHTAYLRLKHGVPAPKSGSASLNSKIVSEQIGGQIFIDGWGLINPGDPERAADFARRAASVSHDGEAIYGAQVVAAMVALAFVERDIHRIIEGALALIPNSSVIRRLIDDLRSGYSKGETWRESRAMLTRNYGYDKFGGNCHLVPNHGVLMMSLLHGKGDFELTMKIVNTSGWDTDCNSGNVGTVVGVLNGLDGLNGKDWRGPVADRLYLPSADTGRAISDVLSESIVVANAGRALAGLDPLSPKGGARFHFALAGSTQGWHSATNPKSVHNTSELDTKLAPGLVISAHDGPTTVATPTFIPPEFKDVVTGYVLVASPTLYPGHRVLAKLASAGQTATGRLFLQRYGPLDESIKVDGPEFSVTSKESIEVDWTIPDCDGYPIHEIGIELDSGQVVLDRMDWRGVPKTSWSPNEGSMWGRAWGKAMNRFEYKRDNYEYMTHNEGTGLLIQGLREWDDYRVRTRLTPKMAVTSGIAVRVQGMQRYYAFVFGESGEIRLEKMNHGRQALASVKFPWKPFTDYQFCVEVSGSKLRLFVDNELILQATDDDRPILTGAIAYVVEAGCLGAGTPSIEPLGAVAY